MRYKANLDLNRSTPRGGCAALAADACNFRRALGLRRFKRKGAAPLRSRIFWPNAWVYG